MLPVLHFLHMFLSAMEAHAVVWMGFHSWPTSLSVNGTCGMIVSKELGV